MKPGRSLAPFLVIPVIGLSTLVSACDVRGQEGDLAVGRQALRSGHYARAERELGALASQGDGAALSGLVTALLEQGEVEDAERRAREGVDAETPGARALLGEILLSRGRVDEARPILEAGASEPGSPGAQARVRLGVLEYRYGDRARAFQLFDGFIDYYNQAEQLTAVELTAVGEALTYLSRKDYPLAHDALKALDEAIAAGAPDHRAQLLVGILFVERYDARQGAEAFQAVLAEHPEHPEALYGLARVAQLEGSGEAPALVDRALEANPEHAGAHTLRSRVRLMDGDWGDALEEAERALEINPRDLEALGTHAAILHLSDALEGDEEALARIEAASPTPSTAYETLSELAADHRKYHDALEFARTAAARDPQAWRGLGLTGLNQVRLGDVDAGRVNLERAFEGDPFNLWFKNTLDLLDTFAEYRTVESEHFRFILHGSEADVLAPFIGPVAERAYEEMTRRYGHTPAEPIRVEVYPNHADFSVRTVGLVGIGALGVSFGPALAMDSPSARGRGEFNWASTLWHEIAHSFHLGVSDYDVPRWFSEGLAVHEQRKGNPNWGHQASPGFVRALAQGELRPVGELDRGFSHPRRPSEVVESYYLASLVFESIERDHGFDAIVSMLRAYREGASNEEAFETALGRSIDDFDRAFQAELADRFSAAIRSVGEESGRPMIDPGDIDAARAQVAEQPGAFVPRMALATALFRADDLDGAIEHFEVALALFPQYGGPDGPHWYLGQIHEQQGQLDEAARHLDSLLSLNESHYEGRKALARVQVARGDSAAAVHALEEIPQVYPFEIEDHEGLAELLEAMELPSRAVPARQAVLALDPVDLAAAHFRLARAHHRAGAAADARREVLRALEIAPNYEEALDLLLELRGQGTSP